MFKWLSLTFDSVSVVFQFQQTTSWPALNHWANMQVFTSDYFFKIIHLCLSTASLSTAAHGCRCSQLDRGIWGGEGAFNNEGPDNLLPGSPWTEEWAAESKLYAMTDDESRGTPSWTQRGMFHIQSPTWTPQPVPRLPRHKRDGNFKQCR